MHVSFFTLHLKFLFYFIFILYSLLLQKRGPIFEHIVEDYLETVRHRPVVYLKGQFTHLVGGLALQWHKEKKNRTQILFYIPLNFTPVKTLWSKMLLELWNQTVAYWIRITRFFKGFKKLHVPDLCWGGKSQTDPADWSGVGKVGGCHRVLEEPMAQSDNSLQQSGQRQTAADMRTHTSTLVQTITQTQLHSLCLSHMQGANYGGLKSTYYIATLTNRSCISLRR